MTVTEDRLGKIEDALLHPRDGLVVQMTRFVAAFESHVKDDAREHRRIDVLEQDADPRTNPGVVSGLHARSGLVDTPSAAGLENPPTGPGTQRSRWDPPSLSQSMGWGAALTAAVVPLVVGVVSAYASAWGFRPPAVPQVAPVEVHVETPAPEAP